MNKICNGCKLEKDIREFNKNSASKDGHRNECRLCHKIHNARWWNKNKERLVIRNREWKRNNRDKVLETTKQWQKKQLESNSDWALAHSLRTRLNVAIRNGYRAGSAVRDLGCTIEEFRKHIESQFQDGMTWDNRGRWGKCWHIDHIKPLAMFDLTDKEQFMEACNYTNMQPMWCEENNAKSDWR
jgi:hypothetical protein